MPDQVQVPDAPKYSVASTDDNNDELVFIIESGPAIDVIVVAYDMQFTEDGIGIAYKIHKNPNNVDADIVEQELNKIFDMLFQTLYLENIAGLTNGDVE